MQNITSAIARFWNSGCLGKFVIGFVALLILGCVGSVLGGRQAPQQATAPTTLPTDAPPPTRAPEPTAAPVPTDEPSPVPLPTEPPATPFVIKGVAPVGSTCPAEAPVKGNIVDRGARKGDKIYHVPGSTSYQQTRPERCFATVADAEDAGYRAPAN